MSVEIRKNKIKKNIFQLFSGNDQWQFNMTLNYYKKSENFSGDIQADPMFRSKDGPLPVQKLPYQDVNVRALLHAFKELGEREYLTEIKDNTNILDGLNTYDEME